MSSDEQIISAQRKSALARQFYKRACAEGRGDQALAKLRALKAAVALTNARSDDDILFQMKKWADEERTEVRQIIEECVNKTDFDREESDPLIRQYMIEDLEEQSFVNHILKHEHGYTDEQLPKLNKTLARLNAYERREGRKHRWSYNDDEHAALRIQVHEAAQEWRKFVKSIPPTPTLN